MNVSNGELYFDKPIRLATQAALFWGVVGMLVGVVLAAELIHPTVSMGISWLNFGRLRPVHTSGVIFAFAGNVLIATSLYIVQRTCRAPLWGGEKLSLGVVYAYQLFIVIAALGYMAGVTQGKEYAEPEWYADLFLTVIWVLWAAVFFGTVFTRREKHIYVANWFYMAMFIVVAVLHLGNNIAVPVSFFGTKSYELFTGARDAMVQWWYGHNAVGFLLTAPFLGLMYYFVPKQVGRPVYSYSLSIIHFWALVFFYIWAGPHHLLYTAIPSWLQTLGMVMSVILWVPSWGGMINGILTCAGAWDKIRTDPVLRFMITALAFYGVSTFEGPLLAIRSVSALAHYTDWIIGHVHSGALGWVGLISFGAIYHLVPRLWKREAFFSQKLIEWHFWLAAIGIAFYLVSMWMAGITQGLMWRAYNSMGFLRYSFIETVTALHPLYMMRALGGLCYLLGFILMVYNVAKTIKGPSVTEKG